jgi:hypothetical protein
MKARFGIGLIHAAVATPANAADSTVRPICCPAKRPT